MPCAHELMLALSGSFRGANGLFATMKRVEPALHDPQPVAKSHALIYVAQLKTPANLAIALFVACGTKSLGVIRSQTPAFCTYPLVLFTPARKTQTLGNMRSLLSALAAFDLFSFLLFWWGLDTAITPTTKPTPYPSCFPGTLTTYLHRRAGPTQTQGSTSKINTFLTTLLAWPCHLGVFSFNNRGMLAFITP